MGQVWEREPKDNRRRVTADAPAVTEVQRCGAVHLRLLQVQSAGAAQWCVCRLRLPTGVAVH